ncbi:hypothetical protein SASPL_150379 [Salvia splendens]|uniref:FAS1 domain-containing protein n=2 Tax=Salvia splendens TaxID=180675 RepID=A0A8X8W600_SALSN|nr:hypothetical protein SASPL_150379 [Salvia splendens]
MPSLLSHQYPLPTLKNILSLHVFADYFGSKKLHQITKGSTTTSTLFQASGEAAGTSGYINITDFKGGKVGFTPVDSDFDPPMATFLKSIHESPYNISVIQISNVLASPEAEAPVSAPTDLNLLSLLADVFTESVEAGLTEFSPSDAAIKSFSAAYKNLTAAGKNSLLLYHGIPEYNSLGMLRDEGVAGLEGGGGEGPGGVLEDDGGGGGDVVDDGDFVDVIGVDEVLDEEARLENGRLESVVVEMIGLAEEEEPVAELGGDDGGRAAASRHLRNKTAKAQVKGKATSRRLRWACTACGAGSARGRSAPGVRWLSPELRHEVAT